MPAELVCNMALIHCSGKPTYLLQHVVLARWSAQQDLIPMVAGRYQDQNEGAPRRSTNNRTHSPHVLPSAVTKMRGGAAASVSMAFASSHSHWGLPLRLRRLDSTSKRTRQSYRCHWPRVYRYHGLELVGGRRVICEGVPRNI